MNSTTEAIIGFLKLQDILTQTVTPKAYYLNTDRTDSKGRANSWPSLATDVPAKDNLKMSLASMLAAEQVQPKPNETILDLCAAPGMKSIYLSLLEPKITLYCNDVSRLRLQRMRALHEQYGVKAQYSLRDASSTIYSDMQFDKILVDAPCSGEGVALAGDIKMAEAWNVKKVQRLQQLQYRILKQAWKALKPGGTLIYATCTLNRSEK